MDELEGRKAKRLMHRVLDGEAGEGEARRLEAHLEASPGDAAEYGELVEVSKILRRAPRAEAPPDFADQVLRRVFETPFRTEVWPQLMPVIRRLAVAATVLVAISMGTASLEALNQPTALFVPQDPPGVTALRPGLGQLGHRVLGGGEAEASNLLRAYARRAFTASPTGDATAREDDR